MYKGGYDTLCASSNQGKYSLQRVNFQISNDLYNLK